MRTTLFHIPPEVAGLPMFGFGWLLMVWLVVCATRLARQIHRHGVSATSLAELPTMLVAGAIIAFVLPALVDESGLPIRGYGVMLFLGVVSGVALAAYRAQRAGYNPEVIYALAFWMCIAGIVGARVFFIIEYWPEFQRGSIGETLRAMLNFTQGGLVVYGSLIGASVAAVVYLRRHQLPVLALADVIAPSMTLGLALGRLGCFLNGCCFGGQCDLPWAVTFPAGSPPYVAQIERGDFARAGFDKENLPLRSLPVHPAQLYAALDALLLTGLLLAWYPLRRHDGEVLALMLTVHPISRFLQEIVRIDEQPVLGTGLSISQNVSLLVFVGAVVLWIVVLRGPKLRHGAGSPK